MKYFKKFLGLLPYVVVFLTSLYTPSDPDLGWHLKYGEYFWQHGKLLRDNTFSTMMPNFHWANTDWVTDIITYAVFHSGGFVGLTLLSAAVVTLTFFCFAKACKLSLWQQVFIFPLLLYFEVPVNDVSFRGQQLTLLFLGVLFWILRAYIEDSSLWIPAFAGMTPKKVSAIWLTVPLFWMWVNVNGEFLLGLGVFLVWIVSSIILHNLKRVKNAKNIWKIFAVQDNWQLLIAFFFSCFVTVLNPFGVTIHLEALSHVGSPLLKDIAEYLPFPMFSQQWWNLVAVLVLALLGCFFLFLTHQLEDKLPFFIVGIVLLVFSFAVRRYAWPTYYVFVPMLAPLPDFFKPDNKKTATVIISVLLALLVYGTIVGRLPLTQFTTYSWGKYCHYDYLHCSPKSAKFLITHHLTNNLFSLYSWGCWLIWNYPKIKPAIDGRMHLWRDANGYSAFADYYSYEQNEKDIDRSRYDVVYISPDKPVYNHLLTLVKQGKWKLVYRDAYADIFIRKDEL